MSNSPTTMRGVVRGRMIEVDGDLNLPEGQQVAIIVQPLLSPEEAIRRSAGGWSDDPEGVDRFVEEMRRLRNLERPEPAQ
ncbi:MAG: hypothetical protein ABSG68_03470 [Thermoguttaceae bacterium]